MDNARSNKCWTIIAGFSALQAAGICVKTKLSFNLASHGHNDIDGTIANVVTKVANKDLETFSAFTDACKDAISVKFSSILEVFLLVITFTRKKVQ